MSLSLLTENRAKPWLPIRCGALTCSSITATAISTSSLSVAGPITGATITGTTGTFSTSVSTPTVFTSHVDAGTISCISGITVSPSSDFLNNYVQSIKNGAILASGFVTDQLDLENMRLQVINNQASVHFPPFVVKNGQQNPGRYIYWESPSAWEPYTISGTGYYFDSSNDCSYAVSYYKVAGTLEGRINPISDTVSSTPDFNSTGGDYAFQPALLCAWSN